MLTEGCRGGEEERQGLREQARMEGGKDLNSRTNYEDGCMEGQEIKDGGEAGHTRTVVFPM